MAMSPTGPGPGLLFAICPLLRTRNKHRRRLCQYHYSCLGHGLGAPPSTSATAPGRLAPAPQPRPLGGLPGRGSMVEVRQGIAAFFKAVAAPLTFAWRAAVPAQPLWLPRLSLLPPPPPPADLKSPSHQQLVTAMAGLEALGVAEATDAAAAAAMHTTILMKPRCRGSLCSC
jgi:hypothetical protein